MCLIEICYLVIEQNVSRKTLSGKNCLLKKTTSPAFMAVRIHFLVSKDFFLSYYEDYFFKSVFRLHLLTGPYTLALIIFQTLWRFSGDSQMTLRFKSICTRNSNIFSSEMILKKFSSVKMTYWVIFPSQFSLFFKCVWFVHGITFWRVRYERPSSKRPDNWMQEGQIIERPNIKRSNYRKV